MGVGKWGQGGHAPPGFSHTLSKTSQISKILRFSVVNSGSIRIAPHLKNFLSTLLHQHPLFCIENNGSLDALLAVSPF